MFLNVLCSPAAVCVCVCVGGDSKPVADQQSVAYKNQAAPRLWCHMVLWRFYCVLWMSTVYEYCVLVQFQSSRCRWRGREQTSPCLSIVSTVKNGCCPGPTATRSAVQSPARGTGVSVPHLYPRLANSTLTLCQSNNNPDEKKKRYQEGQKWKEPIGRSI